MPSAKSGSAAADAAQRIGTGKCRRLQLAEVRLQEGETLENALRRFKRKVLQEDIIKEDQKTRLLLEARAEAPRQVRVGP